MFLFIYIIEKIIIVLLIFNSEMFENIIIVCKVYWNFLRKIIIYINYNLLYFENIGYFCYCFYLFSIEGISKELEVK